MTENKQGTQELGELDENAIVIPEGYELVLVQVGEKETIDQNCGQCGGASMHTAAQCVYCGTGRTHYEYKKLGAENEAGEISGKPSTMSDATIVNQGSLEGEIWSEKVTIGKDSVVGNIVGGDNVNMDDNSKAGFIFSPIIRTEDSVTVSQMATSVLVASGALHADIVTIYDGGRVNLESGTVIKELRLGKGVTEPEGGWFTSLKISKVVRGDFPKPREWNK